MNTEQIQATTGKYIRASFLRELLPNHRAASCMRIVRRDAIGVDILHNTERNTARYGNLCVCANGWVCPVCAARLSEKKARRLEVGLRNHPEVTPVMVTLTMSHHQGERLETCFDDLGQSFRDMRQDRRYRDIMTDWGVLSSITALEVTYGDNGWHPHYHALLLCDRPMSEVDAEGFEASICGQWVRSLAQRSRVADREHGCIVSQSRYSIAQYIAKFGREPMDPTNRTVEWGIERELAKGVSKIARDKNGASPQALLAASQGDRLSLPGILFSEYATATAGRKIMTVSATAKELLGLTDIDEDEKLIDERDTTEILLATLTREQWRKILGPPDRRSELLAIAGNGRTREFIDFIDGLSPDDI